MTSETPKRPRGRPREEQYAPLTLAAAHLARTPETAAALAADPTLVDGVLAKFGFRSKRSRSARGIKEAALVDMAAMIPEVAAMPKKVQIEIARVIDKNACWGDPDNSAHMLINRAILDNAIAEAQGHLDSGLSGAQVAAILRRQYRRAQRGDAFHNALATLKQEAYTRAVLQPDVAAALREPYDPPSVEPRELMRRLLHVLLDSLDGDEEPDAQAPSLRARMPRRATGKPRGGLGRFGGSQIPASARRAVAGS